MKLPVSRDVLLAELDLALRILQKWHQQVTEGVPGVDTPAPEDRTEEFVHEMCGELLLVTGKCQTLAEVLYGR